MEKYKNMKNPFISYQKSLERKRKRQGNPTIMKIKKKKKIFLFKLNLNLIGKNGFVY